MLSDETGHLIHALSFAADCHQHQRRKGEHQEPYINHLIEVMELLWTVGQVRDETLLASALLHDCLEDTDVTETEVRQRFGSDVAELVLEVTDDTSLIGAERKRIQIEEAPHLSADAKRLKLADKTSNIRALRESPPRGWPLERQWRYLRWSRQVVAGLRGVCPALEQAFDRSAKQTENHLTALEAAENNRSPQP